MIIFFLFIQGYYNHRFSTMYKTYLQRPKGILFFGEQAGQRVYDASLKQNYLHKRQHKNKNFKNGV